MASGFFALFDDVATLLDDVAAMSKIATKKTAGILGDDLAVNAEKATGFVSSRELPVIWAITKGSFLNKLIILPLIIGLSAFAPWAVVPILMLGGLYLAYEGAEKIYEYFFPHAPIKIEIVGHGTLDLDEINAMEQKKIKSAILTDFILSLEIVIISLSTVVDKSMPVRIIVLILIAVITTIGVYGIVALIVRLDDMGFAIMQKGEKYKKKTLQKLGFLMVNALPYVIKTLAVVGTIAMLLVAGGIYLHNLHWINELFFNLPFLLAELLVGLIVGVVVLGFVKLFILIKNKF